MTGNQAVATLPPPARRATTLLGESLPISRELGMRPLMERVLSRREILLEKVSCALRLQRLLGVPADLTDRLGPEVVVATAGGLSYQKGALQIPVPTPTVIPQPTPGATPEPTPTAVPLYSLSVSVEPFGSGTVTFLPPGGVYVAGTNVTLTALPAPGFAFDHWSGDVSGVDIEVVVTMDGDRALTAHFKVKAPLP